MLHIDFSENWTVKTLSAVQSAHFGASVEQITLHTGMAYFSENEAMPFCTISDSRDHGPAAIWSHLIPVLHYIKEHVSSDINVIHFVSDGPTTLYRNRYNFFLASFVPVKCGFRSTWWNFSEAGHGKGPADGVGAAIKRLADSCILSGREIRNAAMMYEQLKTETHVQLFLVSDFIKLPDGIGIPAFPGTMKVHQFLAETNGRISYRNLSCYCACDKMCQCNVSKTVHCGTVDVSGIELPTDVLRSSSSSKSTVSQLDANKADHEQANNTVQLVGENDLTDDELLYASQNILDVGALITVNGLTYFVPNSQLPVEGTRCGQGPDANSSVDQVLADGPGGDTCPDAVNHVADVPVEGLDPQHNALASGSIQGMA
jgi:hypothetical protein